MVFDFPDLFFFSSNTDLKCKQSIYVLNILIVKPSSKQSNHTELQIFLKNLIFNQKKVKNVHLLKSIRYKMT